MVFSIPISQIHELNAFFRYIIVAKIFKKFRIIENKDDDEDSQELRRIVSDWGLSQTTLEEVFMKVKKRNSNSQNFRSLERKKRNTD